MFAGQTFNDRPTTNHNNLITEALSADAQTQLKPEVNNNNGERLKWRHLKFIERKSELPTGVTLIRLNVRPWKKTREDRAKFQSN